jgi:hypothetical protein
MTAVSGTTGQYSSLIVPHWMWPKTEFVARATAQQYADAKLIHESSAQDYHAAAGRLSELTEGAASDAMVYAHKRVAIDYDTTADIADHLHSTMQEAAALCSRLTACLDQIDYDAHREIDAAPSAIQSAIIARWQATAQAAHKDFTAAVGHLAAYAQKAVDPLVAAMCAGGRPKVDNLGNSIQALDDDGTIGRRGDSSEREDGRERDIGLHSDDVANAPKGSSDVIGSHGDVRDAPAGDGTAGIGSHDDLVNPPVGPLPPPIATPRTPAPSPLSAGGGLPGGLSAGGLQGLGGGNPLSSSTSSGVPGAAAGVPGARAGGSVPNVAPAAPGDPSAAFARSLSAGAGASSPLSSAISSAPPSTATAAESMGAAAVPPASGAAPTLPASPAGIAATSGAHAPTPVMPPVAGAPQALTAMPMLPPPGMGGPAAPGGGRPVQPVVGRLGRRLQRLVGPRQRRWALVLARLWSRLMC